MSAEDMADGFAGETPPERDADCVILRPPNRLKARVIERIDLNPPCVDPVRRAEQALGLLESEFGRWIEDDVDALEAARLAACRSGAADDQATLHRRAHDLRGQAATLGFPLVGEVADGLCRLLEGLGAAEAPQSLVDRHVEAIRAMVRENVRTRDHPLGVALTRRLDELRRRAAARPDEGR